MNVKTPQTLYRFRWLDANTFAREMDALENSYLFAPPFHAMNDPMEAFYETGSPADGLIDAVFKSSGKSAKDMYKLVEDMIANFALVSFTGTYEALPLWAYYANNFAGMCLEFDTDRLFVGDFQQERLLPVTYARHALPPIGFHDFGPATMENAVLARITRKRSEWSHEKEWRFITGAVGKKHYLDDALTRVYLGPRIDPNHADRICNVLANRPVDVLQGAVRGFELDFALKQKAKPLDQCVRVGAGKFDPATHLYAEAELRAFLGDSYDKLVAECRATILRPNVEEPAGIDIPASRKDAIYFHTRFKLRNGRDVYEKRYFDKKMRHIK